MFNLINPNIQTGLIYTLGGNSHSGGGGGGGQGDKDAQPSLAFCANYYLNSGATVKVCILFVDNNIGDGFVTFYCCYRLESMLIICLAWLTF